MIDLNGEFALNIDMLMRPKQSNPHPHLDFTS